MNTLKLTGPQYWMPSASAMSRWVRRLGVVCTLSAALSGWAVACIVLAAVCGYLPAGQLLEQILFPY